LDHYLPIILNSGQICTGQIRTNQDIWMERGGASTTPETTRKKLD